jgi:hypothetical protein
MHCYNSDLIVPEIFVEMLEIPPNSNSKFCIYYSSKPTYYDGSTLFTFGFYDVYQPFVKHPVILHEIAKASRFFENNQIDLGSDDTEPQHVIVIQENRKLQIAEFNKAMAFLRHQRPNETIELTYEEMQNLSHDLSPVSMAEFRKRGLFELFSLPSIEAVSKRSQMIEQLNQLITDNLIQSCASILNISESQALLYLSGGTY